MPMREPILERVGEVESRVKCHESEGAKPARDDSRDAECFAFVFHLNDDDLGAAARVERDASDIGGDAIAGENLRHSSAPMCKKHTRETRRLCATAARGIEESSIEWRRDASFSDSR
jgi:hypothetical protein